MNTGWRIVKTRLHGSGGRIENFQSLILLEREEE